MLFALGHGWTYRNAELVTLNETLHVGFENFRRYFGQRGSCGRSRPSGG